MSNKALGWAFDQQPAGGALSKLVLVAIADHANHDSLAWPSVAVLARRCQMGRSTVLSHLSKLEAAGLIVRSARFVGNRQTSNVYYIPCNPGEELPEVGGVLQPDGSTSGTGEGSTSGGGRVQQRDPRGSSSGTLNPNKNHQLEPTTADGEKSNGTKPGTAVAPIIKPLPAIHGPRNAAALVQRLGLVFADVAADSAARYSREQTRRVMAGALFAYWANLFDHPRALLDEKREGVLMRRVEESGDDMSELLYALDGAKRDPWVVQNNDGIDWILRNRAHVEKYANKRPGYRDRTPHPLVAKYAAIFAAATDVGPGSGGTDDGRTDQTNEPPGADPGDNSG